MNPLGTCIFQLRPRGRARNGFCGISGGRGRSCGSWLAVNRLPPRAHGGPTAAAWAWDRRGWLISTDLAPFCEPFGLGNRARCAESACRECGRRAAERWWGSENEHGRSGLTESVSSVFGPAKQRIADSFQIPFFGWMIERASASGPFVESSSHSYDSFHYSDNPLTTYLSPTSSNTESSFVWMSPPSPPRVTCQPRSDALST